MAMKFLMLVVVSLLFLSCTHQSSLKQVSSIRGVAESVYLTQNENNDPVLVWTEHTNDTLQFFLSVSHDGGSSFKDRITVPLSKDVATHAEGMPKVAFKDGSIIIAYERKSPTEGNKYAGAIIYRSSNDGGKTWSEEKFLHSDTTAGRSRSYFDIERLANGEIGAAWLDTKLDEKTSGRSVRFATTRGNLEFGNELLIDSSACQCCRIDLYSDVTGTVNVAYRGLAHGQMGQPIRDMMMTTSNNNGKTFTSPRKISQDNWMIDGCPHTGPSLCGSKSGLYSVWYTGGNGTGIFASFKRKGESDFKNRKLISSSGRQPQASVSDSRSIIVWQEATGETGKKTTNVFCQVSDGIATTRECLSLAGSNASSPVVTQASDGFVVAFLMETWNGTGLFTKKL